MSLTLAQKEAASLNLSHLSIDAQLALYVYRHTKSAAREEFFYREKNISRLGYDGSFNRAVDELLAAGALKKNKAGAVSLSDVHKIKYTGSRYVRELD